MRQCPKCKRELDLVSFAGDRKGKDGLQARCRDCNNAYAKTPHGRELAAASRAKPERKKYQRNYHLQARYGITLGAWQEMFDRQGGKCPGCGSPLEAGFKTHVDHCHKTGRVRGLLCKECNLALGNVNDSIDVLRNLIQYLTGA